MKPHKLIGWAVLAAALALLLLGDFGAATFLTSVLTSLAAIILLAIGMVLVAT